jgi:PPP family 3-phenylpropionic acid transporter
MFWGLVADATKRHARLFRLSIAGVVLLALALAMARSFAALLLLVAVFSFCRTPISTLMDHSVIEALGEERHRYGKIRLWGAVGWGIAAPVMGWIVDAHGLRATFVGYAALMGCGLIISFGLPVSSTGIGQRWGRGLVTMFSDRRWLTFMLTVLLSGISLSVVHIYLFLYLDALGATSQLMGLALSVATVGEVAVFGISDRLLRRLGTRGTLMVALGAHVLRVLAYAAIRQPWMALPVQLLHGLSFSALWVACVSLASEIAPPGLGTTAQGVLNSVHFGLGGAIAGLVGGMISERLGFGVLFLFAAAAGLAGLALVSVTGKRSSRDPLRVLGSQQ